MAKHFLPALLAAAAACVVSVSALEWDGLRSTYSPLSSYVGKTAYYTLPRTIPELHRANDQVAKTIKNTDKRASETWVQVASQADIKNIADTYCLYKNFGVCLIFDKHGSIAGYQLSIPTKVDTLDHGLKYTEIGFDRNTIFNETVYSLRFYFESPSELASGGRHFNGETATGLWVKIRDTVVEIPTQESELAEKIPEFTKQNCRKKIGQYYYYNMSEELTVDDYIPIFLLYSSDGKLEGFGILGYGCYVEGKSLFGRNPWLAKSHPWFEFLPKRVIKDSARDAPEWMLDYKVKYGPYAHHVWLISDPINSNQCEGGNKFEDSSQHEDSIHSEENYQHGLKPIIKDLLNPLKGFHLF